MRASYAERENRVTMYDEQINSEQDSQPVDLYRFVETTSAGEIVSGFTDYTEDLMVGGLLYEAHPISRTGYRHTDRSRRSGITITATDRLEVARRFTRSPPRGRVAISVFQLEIGTDETVLLFDGFVLRVDFERREASLNCEPAIIGLQRNGLQRKFYPECPHQLFDDKCRAPQGNFESTVSLTKTGPLQYTANLSGPAVGGVIEAGGETFSILEYDGTTVTVDKVTDEEFSEGLYTPGCDKTPQTCTNVYTNILNFGGTPYVPANSPFLTDVF